MSKSKLRKHRAKIYYGTSKTPLFWLVDVSDAKQPVTINGSLMDALKGTAGQSIGCHLSHCALRNQDAFPHPVYFASFSKKAVLVVDKITNGRPSHAVRYYHEYADLVDLNDTDKSKKFIKAHPELAEREFRLSKPWKNPHRPVSAGARDRGEHNQSKKTVVPYGALRRAQKAGLITADLASACR